MPACSPSPLPPYHQLPWLAGLLAELTIPEAMPLANLTFCCQGNGSYGKGECPSETAGTCPICGPGPMGKHGLPVNPPCLCPITLHMTLCRQSSEGGVLTTLRRKSFSVPPSMYSVSRFSFLSLYSTPMNLSTLGWSRLRITFTWG